MSQNEILAAALLGRPVDALVAVAGGGNNRIYRVVAGSDVFAMKRYDAEDAGGRQRFERETAASTFLAETGLADRIPRLVAVDPAHAVALFDWVEGTSPEDRLPTEIEQMLKFVLELQALSSLPAARQLDGAAEACLSLAELAQQIDRRRTRLGAIEDDPGLSNYLVDFDRIWQRLRPGLTDDESSLPHARQTLSPSDFGLHNALRRPCGRLAFLDFEYFGWDDPVKLTADMMWHPGMALSRDEQDQVRRTLTASFGRHDTQFARRLSRAMPAYGLRWCLILLNEFLPERWVRRRQAQAFEPADWQAAKRRQLCKAERLIARVETCSEEILQ